MDQSREAGREQAHLVTLAETLAPTLAPTLASTLDLTNFAVAFGYRSKRLFHLPRTVNGTGHTGRGPPPAGRRAPPPAIGSPLGVVLRPRAP